MQNCDLSAALQDLIVSFDPSSTDKLPREHSDQIRSAPLLCFGIDEEQFLESFGVSLLARTQAILVRTPQKKAQLSKLFKYKDEDAHGGRDGCVMTIADVRMH